jgi:hypothetical protein
MGSVLVLPRRFGLVRLSPFLRQNLAKCGIWLLGLSKDAFGRWFSPLAVIVFVLSLRAAPVKMKKLSSKKSSAKSVTSAANLEARFDAGKDVLDYFDLSRAVVTHGGVRPGAGRKATGKVRKTVKLSPEAVGRIQDYARRKHLPNFSAALEAVSSKL